MKELWLFGGIVFFMTSWDHAHIWPWWSHVILMIMALFMFHEALKE